jgi:hypothetical protein
VKWVVGEIFVGEMYPNHKKALIRTQTFHS